MDSRKAIEKLADFLGFLLLLNPIMIFAWAYVPHLQLSDLSFTELMMVTNTLGLIVHFGMGYIMNR
jgi:hypothetical protein